MGSSVDFSILAKYDNFGSIYENFSRVYFLSGHNVF